MTWYCAAAGPVWAGPPRGPAERVRGAAPGALVQRAGLWNVSDVALRAVAGDAATGVAVGDGLLWWSSATHQAWHPAQGVDSATVYTAVVKAGGRYLVTAEGGSVWISADGTGQSFHPQATASSHSLRAIAEVSNAALVAVGDSGTIVRCGNLTGALWTAQESPAEAHLRGVAWNGVSVVAVGDGGTLLRAGSSGTGWQSVEIDETQDLLAITVDPPPGSVGRYLAVGRGGALWRGEGDGLTWTRMDPVTTGALMGAAWIGPAAVTVGEGGGIYRSPGAFDNWSEVTSPVTTNLNAAAYTGVDMLAVGADYAVLWSLDGNEWQRAEVPVPTAATSWGRVKQLFHR